MRLGCPVGQPTRVSGVCVQGLLGSRRADPEGFSAGTDSRKSEEGGEACRPWGGREWIHGAAFSA